MLMVKEKKKQNKKKQGVPESMSMILTNTAIKKKAKHTKYIHLQLQKLLSRGASQMVSFSINMLFLECRREKWGWIANARDLCELDSDHSHLLLRRNFSVLVHTAIKRLAVINTSTPPHAINSQSRTQYKPSSQRKGWQERDEKEKRTKERKRGRGEIEIWFLYHRRE